MSRRSKFTIEFDKRYGSKLKSRSKASLSKFFNIPRSILDAVYDRGKAAYFNNPSSVRSSVKSSDQWSKARLYKAILNIMDVRAGKKKINKGPGQDGDLVEKATKPKKN